MSSRTHRSVDRTNLDRQSLRADTPGVLSCAHLNNAGSALSPRCVTDAVIEHLRREEVRGGYEAAAQVADRVEAGRHLVAQSLGSQAHNIAYVESSTAALHRVLTTLPLNRGDRVLVSGAEYGATVLPLLQLVRRRGLRLEYIPDGPDGSTDPTALARMLNSDVKAVFVVHAPSHNGLVNDVGAIGAAIAASNHSPWYVVDACQSWGQLPVDATEFQADYLYASGRKFLRGPRGTGALVVSDRALQELAATPVDIHGATWTEPSTFQPAETAVRYENFERSYAALLGLIAAVEYELDCGIANLQEAIHRNAEYLRSRIGSLPGWEVLDRGAVRSGIVAIRHEEEAAETVLQHMAASSVNAALIRTAIHPSDMGTRPGIRLSPHAYNNIAELDRAISVLRDDAPVIQLAP